MRWTQRKKPELSTKYGFWKNQEKPPKITTFGNFGQKWFSWFFQKLFMVECYGFLLCVQCIKTLLLSCCWVWMSCGALCNMLLHCNNMSMLYNPQINIYLTVYSLEKQSGEKVPFCVTMIRLPHPCSSINYAACSLAVIITVGTTHVKIIIRQP